MTRSGEGVLRRRYSTLSRPHRWHRYVATLAIVVSVGAFGVWLAFQLENKDIAQVCGLDFQRGRTEEPSRVDSLFGTLHKIGESRDDDALMTSEGAWPSGCDGPTPTVIFSKTGDRYQVWELKGGP